MSTLAVISDFLRCPLGAIFVRSLVGIGCLILGRWEVLGFSFIGNHNIDLVMLILLSLLLRVLVSILYEIAVITILGYCPLMSSRDQP
jgi:hypothetical protein